MHRKTCPPERCDRGAKTKKTKVQIEAKKKVEAQSATKPNGSQKKASAVENPRVVNRISPPRVSSNGDSPRSKGPRVPQFAYMRAPGSEHDFQVGDTVEVYCDHEKNKDRVRGWIRGIVVQVDNKMVAVQFRSNVFLTGCGQEVRQTRKGNPRLLIGTRVHR